MKTLQFKTNINCGGCVKAVTPTLNQEAGAGNWQVDTANPDKILTISSDQLTTAQVVEAVEIRQRELEPGAEHVPASAVLRAIPLAPLPPAR